MCLSRVSSKVLLCFSRFVICDEANLRLCLWCLCGGPDVEWAINIPVL